MIARVIDIIDKHGAKGLYHNITVEVEGGRKLSFNSFDAADHQTFLQAKDSGRAVEIVMEKNDKGYDNLKSVKFADHAEAPPVFKAPVPTVTERPAAGSEASRLRAMAVSYAKDLVVAGKAELSDITILANRLLIFIENGKL